MKQKAQFHFNALTPAEAERLALLLEELGEAQQAIGKVLRHGYYSKHPDRVGVGDPDNRDMLERELGDVAAAISLMAAARDVMAADIVRRRDQKLDTVRRFLHHQGSHTPADCDGLDPIWDRGR